MRDQRIQLDTHQRNAKTRGVHKRGRLRKSRSWWEVPASVASVFGPSPSKIWMRILLVIIRTYVRKSTPEQCRRRFDNVQRKQKSGRAGTPRRRESLLWHSSVWIVTLNCKRLRIDVGRCRCISVQDAAESQLPWDADMVPQNRSFPGMQRR